MRRPIVLWGLVELEDNQMWNAVLAGMVALVSADVEVQPLSGPAIRGQLVSLSNSGLLIQTESGEQKLRLEDALLLKPVTTTELDAGLKPTAWVTLVDGSRLRVSSYLVSKRKATLQLLGADAKHEVHTRSITSVRFHEPTDETEKQWQEVLTSKTPGDLVVIRKTPTELVQLDGVLQDVDMNTVTFEYAGDKIPVGLKKLEGFIYFHALGNSPAKPMCKATDLSGSTWNVQSLNLDKGELQIVTVAGVKVQLPLTRVKNLDFSAGNVAYLSDLEPEKVKWTPYLDSRILSEQLFKMYQPRRDQNFDGRTLGLDGRTYDKGLSIHSRTELAYRLTEKYRRFRAEVGIDDSVREGGHVELVVHGDDRELFRQNVTGKDKPFSLDLDIAGVRRLTILVDFGEELDIADHLNLCNARITK